MLSVYIIYAKGNYEFQRSIQYFYFTYALHYSLWNYKTLL